MTDSSNTARDSELLAQLADLEDRAASDRLLLEQRCRRLEQQLTASEAKASMMQTVTSLASIVSWELAVTSGRFSIAGTLGGSQGDMELSFDAFSQLLQAIPSSERIQFEHQFEACLISGESFQFEHRLELPEDRVRYVRHVCKPFLSVDGTPLRAMGLMLDISDDKELAHNLRISRDEAERAAQLKSDFLANMSHEIRTPMNAIIGLNQLLMTTPLSDTQRDYLMKSRLSADGLLKLINEILDLSKIEAGAMLLEQVGFHVESILDHLNSMMIDAVHAKGLNFEVQCDARIRSAYLGDPSRISQVLRNLVGNAIKFTPRGSILVSANLLKSDADSDTISFSVRDTGIGMSEQQRAQLFHPFVQGDASTTRRFGGTGLGLAICKRLVGMMNGSIRVFSTEGGGSEFIVEIPLARSLNVEDQILDSADIGIGSSLVQDPERLKQLHGASVLLVEDNAINRQVAVAFLSEIGLDVDTAEHGAIALDMLRQHRYDCVLMDIQMPIMDGYAATRVIREDPSLRNIPVIALTANVLPEHREACARAGMNDHINKPIDKSRLQTVLINWISPPEKRTERSDSRPGIRLGFDMADRLPASLNGLDLDAALTELGGDRNLLAKLLSDFYADYRNIGEEMRNLFELGAYVDLSREAHTVKSIFLTLGGSVLGRLAAALEFTALQENASDIRQRLDDLALPLNKLMADLAEWRKIESEDQTAPQPIDSVNVDVLFDQLADRIDEMDPEVERISAALKRCMPENPLIDALQDACAAFDFESAAVLLRRIRSF